MNKPRYAPLRLALSMWGLAAAFYLYGFFQRVAPASLANDLMRDFGLTAAALGNLSAFYFYAYAAMQLPTGMLVDRFGPANVLAFGALMAGIGSLLFALSPTTALAAAGRALIGGSHAVAWVALLQLVTHWFALNRFGMMSGLSLAVGVVGAVLAGPPLRWAADAFGWRPVIAAGGALALVVALAIRLRVRDDPRDFGYDSRVPHREKSATAQRRDTWGGLIEIWRSRNTSLLFIANSGVCGAFLTFTGLWGVPFLTQVHSLSVQQASLITSMMLVLFAIGGPAIGTWSDRLQRRKAPYLVGATMTAASFVLLALAPTAPLRVLVPLLLVGAFGTSAMALSFGFAKASVPTRLQGTVTGAVNMGVMMGPLVQMPLIGVILDYRWSGEIVNGVRQYDAAAYQSAWLLLAGWVITSTLSLALTREVRGTRQEG
jgi:sugar phosphate permease